METRRTSASLIAGVVGAGCWLVALTASKLDLPGLLLWLGLAFGIALWIVGALWWVQSKFAPPAAEQSTDELPSLVAKGTTEQWRSASGSKKPNDLQVIYERIRNDAEAGGERATATDAEVVIEAWDQSGKLVRGGISGNWLDLSTGKPHKAPVQTMTLRPSREHGIELAGKFNWSADAYIAGESDPPSLKPGTYTIKVTVHDARGELGSWEWLITNLGAGAQLAVAPREGAPPFEPNPPTPMIPPFGLPAAIGASEFTPAGLVIQDSQTKEPAKKPVAQPRAASSEYGAGIRNERVGRAVDLITESDEFRPRLLIAIRDTKRSGAFTLPNALTHQVMDWNKRVLPLADECLSVEEATDVDTIPNLFRGLAGFSGTKLAAMVDNNRAALGKILQRLEPPSTKG